ncbi:histidinol-phosphate transaminase [bacterium]|nr:histidinol-phosphate transaminase [bacterium]
MNNFFRKNVIDMQGYVPGKQLNDLDIIKLNTNENPYPPPENVISALKNAIESKLNLYPDPLAVDLRKKIAMLYNLDPSQIIAGNGSDEILSIIFRSFVDPKDKVVLFNPTYTLYYTLANSVDADIISYNLDSNFDIPEEIFSVKCKICFIPNPNAPTGNFFDKKKLSRLADSIGGILVIDEAYADFAEDNCLGLLKKHGNIIITRTFSKSFSLAGMRIGYGLSSPEIIKGLMKIKDSYNLNRLSIVAGEAILNNITQIHRRIDLIKKLRDKSAQEFRSLGFTVLDSQTNFLFVKPSKISAEELYKKLYCRKILVRFFDQERVNEFLRITVGTEEQMKILLNAIKKITEN